MIIQALIIVLSLTGLVISIYFTLAYYGRIRKARWVPEILCAREGSSCVTVVQTPYAHVFGVPNSLLGIIYYTSLILCVVADWPPPMDIQYRDTYYVLSPTVIFLPFSTATVLLGFYLIYALRRRLHINCPLCYTAHAINLAIFVLLGVVAW
jgi:uncharacterized membrane protein